MGSELNVRRKMDTVQIVRMSHMILTTMTPETAIQLANALLHDADIILSATVSDNDE